MVAITMDQRMKDWEKLKRQVRNAAFLLIPVCDFYIQRSPGNKWALEHAKRNLVEKYLLVGITEEIGDFIAILEATVPRIFKGATKLFTEGRFWFVTM